MINLFHFIDSQKMFRIIRAYFKRRNLVLPDTQDAATFAAQEAMEAIDVILRRKSYNRNHDKPVDSLGKELAQCLMMVFVTCMLEDIDPDVELQRLFINDVAETYLEETSS